VRSPHCFSLSQISEMFDWLLKSFGGSSRTNARHITHPRKGCTPVGGAVGRRRKLTNTTDRSTSDDSVEVLPQVVQNPVVISGHLLEKLNDLYKNYASECLLEECGSPVATDFQYETVELSDHERRELREAIHRHCQTRVRFAVAEDATEPVVFAAAPPMEVPIPDFIPKPHSRSSLIWERFLGKTDSVAVKGLVQAVYADEFEGEGYSLPKFCLSWWESVKTWAVGSHDERNRTILRVAKVVKRLRPLLERLKCEVGSAALKDVSPLGVAFVESAVRRIVKKAEEEGEIDARQRYVFQKLLTALAPLNTDVDDIAARVARVVGGEGRL